MQISNSNISANVAEPNLQCVGVDGYGGAFYIEKLDNKTLTIIPPVWILNNEAATAGGGLFYEPDNIGNGTDTNAVPACEQCIFFVV
jgi:hypothetical protein